MIKKAPPSEWLTVRLDSIPPFLRQHARWLVWAVDGNGQKTPRHVDRPKRNCDAYESTNWFPFDEAVRAMTAHPDLHLGLGFALGAVERGPTITGVDLDGCRDPTTGEIESWARDVIKFLDSYTEISPSDTGVKIFVEGALPEGCDQGKVYKLEIYDRKRFFAVTGHHLPGTPTTIESRGEPLRQLYQLQRSHNLVELATLFNFRIRERGEWVDILCPWRDEHSTPDADRDAALHRNADGVFDGFNCFHASHADKSIGDIRKLFGLKASRGPSDFISTERGIIANSQDNIQRALQKLDVIVWFDAFQRKACMSRRNVVMPFDEATVRSLWLEIDSKFGFLPGKDLFYDVLSNLAHANQRHPIKEYFASLKWDGVARLDKWLVTYGHAADTPYVRAVGAIVLIAAVRRVRQPGCKFDELLALNSGQGMNKSKALRTLCPNEQWYSDDFPLSVDAKEIIERTGGKWIIEAAELEGLGKRDVGHLKAMLSRQTDGPVRLAYDRVSTEVPRQFIVIGSLNPKLFLSDSTGGRRFWPIEVGTFDVETLLRDRDRLWAEAVAREATGESIRLAEALWSEAGVVQEQARRADPWEEAIEDLVMDEDGQLRDYVEVGTIWLALGKTANHLDNRDADRVASIMQMLGFSRNIRVRIKGRVTQSMRRPKVWVRDGVKLQGVLLDDEAGMS